MSAKVYMEARYDEDLRARGVVVEFYGVRGTRSLQAMSHHEAGRLWADLGKVLRTYKSAKKDLITNK